MIENMLVLLFVIFTIDIIHKKNNSIVIVITVVTSLVMAGVI